MTSKLLDEMGFSVGELTTGRNRIYYPATETEFVITNLKQMKINEFMLHFRDVVYKEGEAYGKVLKAEEIRKALFD